MMLIKPKLILVVLAMLFFISNIVGAEDLLEKEEAVDTSPAASDEQLEEKKANDEMENDDQLQEETKMENDQELADPESPEAKTETTSDELEDPRRRRRRRRRRIPCYCWIGWVRNKGLKYLNFGRIRSFRLFEKGKQSKCSASCSKKCAPIFEPKYYNYLCRKIGKKYHYKLHKVGCFSQVGRRDLPNNLWDWDGSPYGLCCKKSIKSCSSVFGVGFYYHGGMKLCVKRLSPWGPIPDIPNGTVKPPVCCYWNKLYACQKPKYGIAKSVACW